MTITIQRGRQFEVGANAEPIFDAQGRAAGYLPAAGAKLSTQNVSVTLRDGQQDLTLVTETDWQRFLADHCQDREQVKRFAQNFGITFSDFVNVVDDAAASGDRNLSLDLRPQSELAAALSLDAVDGDYATKLAKDAELNLAGGSNPGAASFKAAGVPTIGPEILANPVNANSRERDRTELENWADFKNKGQLAERFDDFTGPAPYAKLYQPKWNDPEAMALVNAFEMPLHLEVKGNDPDGTIKFQDGYELFRDTYFDDRNGAMAKAGASVRTRVRFDKAKATPGSPPPTEPFVTNRVLVQAKEGRSVNGTDSEVHKFEKRWDNFGSNTPTEAQAKAMLVTGQGQSRTGDPEPMEVSQKLYKLAQEKNTLGPDGALQLEETYLVLQKRRRTHLQLDSIREVKARRATLKSEIDELTQTNTPVPAGMTEYLTKLDKQLTTMERAEGLLLKYGWYLPSGECFIVSADRYSVYDAGARQKNPPTDIGDDSGRIGKGPLHLEAEWDSNSSDKFELALANIDADLTALPLPTGAKKEQLEADRKALQDIRDLFLADVAKTVEIVKAKMIEAGFEEDPAKKSKEERAADIANAPNRPQFWF